MEEMLLIDHLSYHFYLEVTLQPIANASSLLTLLAFIPVQRKGMAVTRYYGT